MRAKTQQVSGAAEARQARLLQMSDHLSERLAAETALEEAARQQQMSAAENACSLARTVSSQDSSRESGFTTTGRIGCSDTIYDTVTQLYALYMSIVNCSIATFIHVHNYVICNLFMHTRVL